MTRSLRHCVSTLIRTIGPVACLAVQHGGDGMMNPRRSAKVAAVLCGAIVLAGWVVAWFAGFGSGSIENARAVPIEERRAPSPPAGVELADASQTTVVGNAAIANTDVAT